MWLNKKQRRLIQQVRREFTWFVLICVLVACGYVAYRFFLVLGPNGLGGIIRTEQAKAITIGCNHDNTPLADPSGTVFRFSTAYEKVVTQAQHLSNNLVPNSTLADVDDNTELPDGFYHLSDSEVSTYDYGQDNNGYYLQASASQTAANSQAITGWVMGLVPVQSYATYAYSFGYRSNVPVDVSLEFQAADGSMQYDYVATLAPSKNWQSVAAHFTNHTAVRARFVVASKDAGSTGTRNYQLYQIPNAQLSHGAISITFDDGWRSVYLKARGLLRQYKYPTTQFIISDAAEHDLQEYMNVSMLKDLRKDGDEIASHSLKHCDFVRMSSTQADQDAKESQKALRQSGLGQVSGFAFPYGTYNQQVQQTTGHYYNYLRGTDPGYNDRYLDRQNIRAMVVTDKTTDATIRGWLDTAKTQKTWIVLVYHRIDEHGDYSITSQRLASQLQLIKQSGLPVSTVGQTIDLIASHKL